MIPTKPMMPRNDTHTAVMTEAVSMEAKRSRSTCTPMLFAAASPDSSALNFQAIRPKNSNPRITTTAMIRSVRYVARPRSPNVQMTAAESPTSVA